MKLARSLPSLVAVLVLASGCGRALAQERDGEPERPRNVILMIGDGMGIQHVTLARLAGKDGPSKPLFMETLPVEGYCSTHSADNLVTDSAAAATALATGTKVANGVISVDRQGKPLRTILEAARAEGLATGLVTTTTITHATPAAFAAHVPSRAKEGEIARQYLDSGVDVFLGGGRRHFDDELLGAFEAHGYALVEDREGLERVRPGRVLGLFHRSHMSYELDRAGTTEPSLAEMTEKAIQVLSASKKGFFLMVEGGRIDHAGHAHDAAACIADTLAFDRAIRAASRWAVEDGETLVLVTADHTTGGLAISERIDVAGLARVKASSEAMAARVKAGEKVADVVRAATGIELTPEEIAAAEAATGPYAPATEIAHFVSHRLGVEFYGLAEQECHTSTHGHDGTAVPIYAMGPGSDAFDRFLDNTEVPRVLAKALELRLAK